MRYPLALLLTLAACAADPVLLPDAGPCNGSCGSGTVCAAGACVSVDGGAVDVGGTDAQEADAGPDVPVPDRPAPDVPAAVADAGMDAGSADAGAVDVAPAADVPTMPDAGTSRGVRFQACRIIGGACSDGSMCMRAMMFGTSESPRGLCTFPCSSDDSCTRHLPDSGAIARLVCSGTATTPDLHCEVDCGSGSGSSCPSSTRCYGVPNAVGRDPMMNYPQCQPQSDP